MPLTKKTRAKLSKLMKERHRNGTIAKAKAKARKHRENESNGEPPVPEITPQILGYALGRIEGWLEAVAESHSVSRVALAEQVGSALLSKINREVMGTVYQMPEVRNGAAARTERLPEVALVVRSHRST